MDQLVFEIIPDVARARADDPETSREAAESVKPATITETQGAILALLRFGPMTDEDIYRSLSVQIATSPSGARTRRAELVARGKVRFSGEYGETASGRRTRRWALV